MTLSNIATMAEIISFLQALEGLNNKADLVSALGSPAVSGDSMAALVQRLQTQKDAIAARLTAYGVAAAGTEALEALAAKVPNLTGKKFASGSVTSPASSNVSFQYGTGTYQNYPGVAVSGLAFTPTIIFLISNSGNVATVYKSPNLGYGGYTYVAQHVTVGNYFTNYNMNVTGGSFVLPAYQTNHAFTWLAIE